MSRKKKINNVTDNTIDGIDGIGAIEPTPNTKTTVDIVAEAMQAKWGKKVAKTRAEVVLEEEPTWQIDDDHFWVFADDKRDAVVRAWKYYGSLRHNPALTAEVIWRDFLKWSAGVIGTRFEEMTNEDWWKVEKELQDRVNGK